MKELLDMKLHEIKEIDGYEILRVCGGWVYTRFTSTPKSSVFVPERSRDEA